MTNDTRESVMSGRQNITAGLPKREMTQIYVLQIVSGEILPILKKC
jgi:hypothetical protein